MARYQTKYPLPNTILEADLTQDVEEEEVTTENSPQTILGHFYQKCKHLGDLDKKCLEEQLKKLLSNEIKIDQIDCGCKS